ncbi:glycoside hydrolase family 99-like domain-containing protein [Asticcacaulis excentricus]|uniref:Glycosyltransferase n=1 Tax=Asticcacaulis excentricus TaxID=78587 RepID=A0A3G9G253_9CAUL|nr:glycoside hydrolase family 99-like domain-containing protein [Asticcacaulis excentricus]BBF81380.1 glycosyltransferase [Asticcacaulis excentricus]
MFESKNEIINVIAASGLFDTEYYLTQNLDVAAAGMEPVYHYVEHGAFEGRNPSQYFDTMWYLSNNSDVFETQINPLFHYIVAGEMEGRNPSPYINISAYSKHIGLESNSGALLRYMSKPELNSAVEPIEECSILTEFDVTSNEIDKSRSVDPKVIAFYLPQYHRVKENDEWWGEGFTEWTNVKKASPNFAGHYQPHVPGEMGYYDLDNPEVQRKQTKLAKEYGITAFCYYMYWFDGRRVLERPLDNMLNDKTIDHEFCVCWANENWTRTWDGKADDILLGQVHTPDSDRRFIRDAIKYLEDPRYLRVNGKPMLLVYRVDLLPNCRATAEIWREEARKAGIGELHLCAVQFYGVDSPVPWGFDAAVEFPPHGWLVQENLPNTMPEITNPDFVGTILDYSKAIDWALAKPIPDFTWYRGCFPGWDNTARRQNTPHLFCDNDPFMFQRWFQSILEQTVLMAPPEHQIVFVNAWNEWGEGAHLEPCERFGRLNLSAVHSALSYVKSNSYVLTALQKLRTVGSYADRHLDEQTVLHHIRANERSLRALSAHLRSLGVNPMAVK